MKLIFSMATAAVLFAGCAENNKLTINGSVAGDAPEMVYLERMEDIRRADKIDSSVVSAEGKFSFTREVENTEMYRILFGRRNGVFFTGNKGETLGLNITLGETFEYNVDGNPVAKAIEELYKNSQKLNAEFRIGYQAFLELDDEAKKEAEAGLEAAYTEMQENERDSAKDFIAKNKNHIAAVYVTNYLDQDKDFDIMNDLAETIKTTPAGSTDYGKSFLNHVDELGKLSIGADAPEISLPSPDGENVPLSSLKGQYVLVDFWASWCKPCREENPNVVAAYNKYKENQFSVYGVSLDKEKDAWVQAIKTDNLTWPHVSDLQFWSSAAAKTYKVNAIPANVLVGPDGKIVAKNLRGEELQSYLEGLFEPKS
ncbi:MAG: peroxiredoxin [Sphingobacteriales bacterium]|jgi:peroxiredoxin